MQAAQQLLGENMKYTFWNKSATSKLADRVNEMLTKVDGEGNEHPAATASTEQVSNWAITRAQRTSAW
jgi:hypothetical protein